MTTRKVRLELTPAEARALLTSNTHTGAGDLLSVFKDGHATAAFDRVDRKLRDGMRQAGL